MRVMPVPVLLALVKATIPAEEVPQLAAFLRWHAQVPNAGMAHPIGVWELYQSVKPCLEPPKIGNTHSDAEIELAALRHVLSLARPPLLSYERRDILAFHQSGAYTHHHLTGIIETYRRWRVSQVPIP